MRVFYVVLFSVALLFPASSQQPNAIGGQQAGHQPADKNSGEPSAPDSVTTHFAPGYRVDRGTYDAICDSPKNKDHADLCQQWRVAEAAETQVIFTICGFIALLGTLLFTGITAVAARQTVTTMQGTAERQLRAYVLTHECRLENWDTRPTITLEIRNFGQTPAHELKVWTRLVVADLPPTPEAFAKPEQLHQAQSVLGPGGDMHSTITRGNALTPEWVQKIRDGKAAIFVAGDIEYFDAFGSRRRATFRYGRGGPYNDAENGPMTHTEDGNETT